MVAGPVVAVVEPAAAGTAGRAADMAVAGSSDSVAVAVGTDSAAAGVVVVAAVGVANYQSRRKASHCL